MFRTSAETIDGWEKKDHLGLRTTVKTKRKGCEALKNLVETGQLEVSDVNIISELSTFVAKRNTYAAESGSHDDLVMPLVLFGWVSTQKYFSDLSGTDRSKLYSDQLAKMEAAMSVLGLCGEESIPEISPTELERLPSEFRWMYSQTHQLEFVNKIFNDLSDEEDYSSLFKV